MARDLIMIRFIQIPFKEKASDFNEMYIEEEMLIFLKEENKNIGQVIVESHSLMKVKNLLFGIKKFYQSIIILLKLIK